MERISGLPLAKRAAIFHAGDAVVAVAVIKSLSIITLLIQIALACHASNGNRYSPPDDFYIRLETDVSEHSMDSNSVATTLTVSGDTPLYQQSGSGAHSGESKPVKIQNDPLYQQSLLLITELYRIINRTDPLQGFQGFTD